ncbi:hypothetical protein EVAR_29982_1 [Eumeta japonica]|uniref:Uncharacterized protein n=1 Tax=Eumeta variegata TaxID=151549 RepID=A0A4C1VGN2_EUMVA|nr:hypothetical protein EVAR_29982_1 [Eumeta japonica]
MNFSLRRDRALDKLRTRWVRDLVPIGPSRVRAFVNVVDIRIRNSGASAWIWTSASASAIIDADVHADADIHPHNATRRNWAGLKSSTCPASRQHASLNSEGSKRLKMRDFSLERDTDQPGSSGTLRKTYSHNGLAVILDSSSKDESQDTAENYSADAVLKKKNYYLPQQKKGSI